MGICSISKPKHPNEIREKKTPKPENRTEIEKKLNKIKPVHF
jgi:hypothetical protein